MARAVRKVSRVSTKNQKKEGLNKKLIAIISAIVVVLLGVAVGLIVYFTTQEDEAYVSDKVYFIEETKVLNKDGEVIDTVTFVKENYYSIVRPIKNDADFEEHIFVFAYDGSAFFADPEDEDKYDEYYETLISRVAQLQYAVNKAKEAEVDVVLYIVDVNVDNQVNAGLMTDAAGLHEKGFSALYSSYDESTTFEPALFYLNEGVVKQEFENGKLASTGTMSKLSSAINYSVNFLNSLK